MDLLKNKLIKKLTLGLVGITFGSALCISQSFACSEDNAECVKSPVECLNQIDQVDKTASKISNETLKDSEVDSANNTQEVEYTDDSLVGVDCHDADLDAYIDNSAE